MIPDFRPMKCSVIKGEALHEEDEVWTSSEWICEEKWDGLSALYFADDRGRYMRSGRISKQTKRLVDNTANVPQFMRELRKLPKGTCLVGEIVPDKETVDADKRISSYVQSLLKGLPARSLGKQTAEGWPLRFAVYDILFYNGKDLRNKELMVRKRILRRALGLLKLKTVFPVRFLDPVVENKKAKRRGQKYSTHFPHAWYLRIVEREHGEGLVFKKKDSKYQTHKKFSNRHELRSKWWRKAKKFKTFDCVIVGFTEPEKTSVKSDNKVSANYNYAHGMVSGVVVGQFVPKADFDFDEIVDLLKKYRKANMTYKDVVKWIQQHSIKYKGKRYYCQPYSVCVGMNRALRSLMSKRRTEYIGKVVEIGSNGRDKKNRRFRHPRVIRMREDKVHTLCIYREDEA